MLVWLRMERLSVVAFMRGYVRKSPSYLLISAFLQKQLIVTFIVELSGIEFSLCSLKKGLPAVEKITYILLFALRRWERKAPE